MMKRTLPSVLQADRGNSISTERALKNIREQLLENAPEGEMPTPLCAALDDIELMLAAINRDD